MTLNGHSAPRAKVAPRPAPATAAIAAVLRVTNEPLSIVEIVSQVERMLGDPSNARP